MLRRILILFVVLVLAGLGLTAAYALLGLREPEDALAEAEKYLRQDGDAEAAVRLLDLCEDGIGMRDNREFLERLWELRYEAHRRLDNPFRALGDLELLLEAGRADEKLELDRIYYLAALGQGALARQRGVDFLEKHPDSPRGHELTGEACKSIYSKTLRELSEQLHSELGHDRVQDGIDAFLEYVYRPDGDPDGAEALLNLKQLYGHEPRFQQGWPLLSERMAGLRSQVQEALGHFRTSLELAGDRRKGGWLAAAYRGVAFALQQADRDDDLIAQSLIYITRYDHRYTTEAAIAAAAQHLHHGLYEAAIALTDRFLPEESFEKRLLGGKLDGPGLFGLLSVRAIALFRLGREAALTEEAQRIGRMAKVMREHDQRLPPQAHHLAAGLAGVLRKSKNHTEGRLRSVFNYYRSRPAPLRGEDPLALLAPLLIDIHRERGATTTELTKLIRDWITVRRNSMEPRRALAHIQLEHSEATAAMATANHILSLNPRDEEALHVLADAASVAYGPSGQDGEGLLLQCLQRGASRPDVPNPVCTLLCGEAALEQNHPNIARACARAAADRFPWARWPRHLEARADLLAKRPQDALQVLTRAIEADSEDTVAVQLWCEASIKAGEPLDRFLSRMVRAGLDNVDIATGMLRVAVEQDSPSAVAHARAAANREDSSAELLGLASQALAAANLSGKAAELLDRAYTHLNLERTERSGLRLANATQAVASAAIRLLESLARTTPDGQLATLAKWHLRRLQPSGADTGRALLEVAERLQESGHVQTAYYLTTVALTLGDAIEIRDGRSFELAGRLALALGQPDVAAAHWTAALTFADGAKAAEPLARLELRNGNLERARVAISLTTEPTDPTLALLTGDAGVASQLANRNVRDDPTDLVATTARALVTRVAPDTIGVELRTAEPATRRSLLELLALMKDKAHADAALLRARSLAEVLPDSPAIRLLLGRALADNGHGAAASDLHAQLFEAGCRQWTLFAEVERAAEVPGYQLHEPIRDELRQRLEQNPARMPGRIGAFTLREMATEALSNGKIDDAVQILADLWRRYPVASGATITDAEHLFDHDRSNDAIGLLGELRQHGDQDQRLAATTALFNAGSKRSQLFSEPQLTALTRTARRVLQQGELIGPPLVFLLEDERRSAGLDKPRLCELIELLIDHCARGRESWTLVEEALRPLRNRLDTHTLFDIFDRATRAHPAMAQLWIERARLMVDLRRVDEGLRDGRSILQFVDSPELELAFLGLAAEQRKLIPDDYERVRKMPAALLETPDNLYVLGLMALRQGQADQADRMLAGATAQPSGFHIYARALANLERHHPDARANAHRLFAELAENYPSSSLARYAGSFARQLASN